ALYKGIVDWQAAKPDPLLGAKVIDAKKQIIYSYSWMTELLPYVGYENLYSKLDMSQTWTASYNLPYAATVVPAFLNPADPRATWDGLGPALAATHFAGMSGVEDGRNVIAAMLPRTDPRAGIFGYDRVARLNEVTDGAAQTIMVIGTGEVVAPWVSGGGATIRGARAPFFDTFSGFGSRGLRKPGTYVLFADGSAREVSANIDPELFKALCTMHGAEQTDLTKLGGQGDN
ncbi:MAG: DUF1559 domain-containing protein, partial [Planctomycetes bacterium]|nr:DUF1559 domain-containing protein [Planctomycetota bacterium]